MQGNLSAFVEQKPEARTYYDLQEATIKFELPEPGFLEGIKSKDRAILKMHKVGFRCVPHLLSLCYTTANPASAINLVALLFMVGLMQRQHLMMQRQQRLFCKATIKVLHHTASPLAYLRRYPQMEKNVVSNVTLQCSLNSRVGVVGPNGAGKSTVIKLLTGELEPQDGVVWKHPNLRVAYVAQHAFHHVEQHLDKTPNQVRAALPHLLVVHA